MTAETVPACLVALTDRILLFIHFGDCLYPWPGLKGWCGILCGASTTLLTGTACFVEATWVYFCRLFSRPFPGVTWIRIGIRFLLFFTRQDHESRNAFIEEPIHPSFGIRPDRDESNYAPDEETHGSQPFHWCKFSPRQHNSTYLFSIQWTWLATPSLQGMILTVTLKHLPQCGRHDSATFRHFPCLLHIACSANPGWRFWWGRSCLGSPKRTPGKYC